LNESPRKNNFLGNLSKSLPNVKISILIIAVCRKISSHPTSWYSVKRATWPWIKE